jgi:hypothetical protein
MRAVPILATACCAVIALAGCGTAHGGQLTNASTSAPGAANAPAAGSPRQRAVADAARIIASFPPPPGSARSARSPSPLLDRPAEGPPVTPDVVTATRWWTAPGQPLAVLAWVAAHLPPGFTGGVRDYGPNGSFRPPYGGPPAQDRFAPIWWNQFGLPPVPDVLAQRILLVAVVRDGADRIAIRVDAQVAWLPAKPSAERIPADATVVTVAPQVGFGVPARQRLADRPVTITDPAQVARIAAVVDGLPVYPPGTFFCPADLGWGIKLTFRAGLNGPVVALVTGDESGCQAVSVVINGRRLLTLADGGSLESQVLKIAGARWPYPVLPSVSPTQGA